MTSYNSKTVEKVFTVLQTFSPTNPLRTLAEISDTTGFSRTTTHRLVKTLEDLRCLIRMPGTTAYQIGPRLLEIGGLFSVPLNVRARAIPYLIDLARETGETAYLAVVDDDEALCIERIEGSGSAAVLNLRVGGRQPLHCGGAGLALLAFMPDDRIISIARTKGLRRLTEHTIFDTGELMRAVHIVRERGYALSQNDVTRGVGALGLPIRDHSGDVVAAVSVSGLVEHFESASLSRLLDSASRTAATVSAALAYHVVDEPTIGSRSRTP